MRLKRNLTILTVLFLSLPMANNKIYGQESHIDANSLVNTFAERIKLSGYAQFGYNYYQNQTPDNEFKINRIIFMASGKITDHFDTYFMFDFNSSTLHELYLNYHLSPAFNVRVGQFKTPFSIENDISPTLLEQVTPYSLPTCYMIMGSDPLMMPGASGRDLGINAFGSLFNSKLDYSFALMNGQGRNKSDANSQKDFVAKLCVHPTSWLSLSASTIQGTGNTTVTQSKTDPNIYESTTAPTITGFKSNGNFSRNRYAIGGTVDVRHISLRSEYMHGNDADSKLNGYYAVGTLKNILHNFDGILSYDQIKIYSGKQQNYGAGVQYWFYPKCRLQLQYILKAHDNEQNQNCIYTQLQFRF